MAPVLRAALLAAPAAAVVLRGRQAPANSTYIGEVVHDAAAAELSSFDLGCYMEAAPRHAVRDNTKHRCKLTEPFCGYLCLAGLTLFFEACKGSCLLCLL